ncbi:MAG: magnesium chelatase subunit D family protein [Elusimicrobiota bacterium]
MHHKHVIYPFSAIVGQEKMKKSLLLNAIDWKIGGVLIRGEKGTAKSTAVRSLADLLPEVEVVADCPFSCNPHNLKEMCKTCQERKKAGKRLPIKKRKMLVIDLPINATEDRVIGALNIEKALRDGIRALEPGILAEANRGILYIDEVNLLDDHIADVLLDAAAMGVNVVEREGISVYHPSKFILIGTMNPEEGELRPQLLDRFGLSVRVERIEDKNQRIKVVKLREKFDREHFLFEKEFEKAQAELRQKILQARKLLTGVRISDKFLSMISQVCIDFAVDGLRADIITTKTAKAIAAFNGRRKVIEADVLEALEFSLEHRMRKQPFEKPEISKEKLKQAFGKSREAQKVKPEGKKSSLEAQIPKEEVFDIGAIVKAEKILERRKDKVYRRSMGRSSKTLTKSKQGKYIKAKIPQEKIKDIAIDATVRAAAGRSKNGEFKIEMEDIREKIRVAKSASLITFVVDASGSMGAKERMKSAKGAILSLLTEAYRKRDRVAMIAFRNEDAYTLLPPTRSKDLAVKRLRELPTGGKTPLPAGIIRGIETIKNEIVKNDNLIPILVLITDGKGNVSTKGNILSELKTCAEEIKKRNLHTIVIDTESGYPRLGLAKEFAQNCDAKYYHLDELEAEKLATIVRSEVTL